MNIGKRRVNKNDEFISALYNFFVTSQFDFEITRPITSRILILSVELLFSHYFKDIWRSFGLASD